MSTPTPQQLIDKAKLYLEARTALATRIDAMDAGEDMARWLLAHADEIRAMGEAREGDGINAIKRPVRVEDRKNSWELRDDRNWLIAEAHYKPNAEAIARALNAAPAAPATMAELAEEFRKGFEAGEVIAAKMEKSRGRVFVKQDDGTFQHEEARTKQ
jgi:hypothetical protein